MATRSTKWYIEVYDNHNFLAAIGDWDSMGEAGQWAIVHIPSSYSITYRAKGTPEEAAVIFGESE